MQTHPALIERSVGATLSAFSRGQLAHEEAEIDLIEVVTSQIVGKTDYAVAVIGYYVRAVLRAYVRKQIDMADVFDAFVDATAAGSQGHMPASLCLSQPLSRLRH
jgi:hypothetical protein